MNERDSDALAADLVQAGYTMTQDESEADLLLFNTCSVRDAAERKAKGKVGFMRKLKKQNPDIIIGIMGCMAQRLGNALIEELPHVDFVLGTGQLHRLLEVVENVKLNRTKMALTEPSPDVLSGLGGHFENSIKGQIAITRGCNRFCSYCIVPYVRGRELSRPAES